jgi:hypothetical protein
METAVKYKHGSLIHSYRKAILPNVLKTFARDDDLMMTFRNNSSAIFCFSQYCGKE